MTTTSLNFPTISKQRLYRQLKRRKHEDIELIKTIDKYLINKRGFVFKMPPPKTPVILLVSGGIDSTICWKILLQEYQLEVYPLFLKRSVSRSKRELKSINFFYKKFRKQYSQLTKKPIVLSTQFSLNKLQKKIQNPSNLHPDQIFKLISQVNPQGPFLQSTFPQIVLPYALLYSQYFKAKNGKYITTIFNGITSCDSLGIPSQSLTSIRIANLSAMASITKTKSWQYVSLLFEPALKHYAKTAEIIRLSNQLNIPLHKTYSCYRGCKNHCGRCQGCVVRKASFKEAKIRDLTTYQDQVNLLKKIWQSINLNLGIKKFILRKRIPLP